MSANKIVHSYVDTKDESKRGGSIRALFSYKRDNEIDTFPGVLREISVE